MIIFLVSGCLTETWKEAESILKMKVNKKLLQQCLSVIVAMGKVVTLKDISNIQTGLVSKEDENNLDALVKKLRDMSCILISLFTYLYMYVN